MKGHRVLCDVHVMSRHTSPNKRRIDDAFPIRVKIKVPPDGLGLVLNEINGWLNENLGVERCRTLPTRGVNCNAKAIYFREMSDANSFLAAFPALELADGTRFLA